MKLVGLLISFACLLQGLEMLTLKGWSWRALAGRMPWFLKSLKVLAASQMLLACLCLFYPNPYWVGLLLLVVWSIAWRWGGTFNGGSDKMTIQVLLAWLVSLLFPNFEKAAVMYVCIQLILSYFVAGLAKVRNPDWCNGVVIQKILPQFNWNPILASSVGIAVLLFELAFPLSVFFPSPFIAMGVLFHLMNFYFLGLNRFFWVWLACYPALLFVANG